MGYGKNIKTLRRIYGESLSDLSDFLYVSKSSLSEYESEKYQPSFDTLTKISNHYGVSVDDLLNSNFEISKDYNIPIDDKEKMTESFDTLLPFCCSEKALSNNDFSVAYNIHQKFYNDIKDEKISSDDVDIEKSIEYYYNASQQGIFESYINISWFLILFVYLQNKEGLMKTIEKYKKGRVNQKEVLKSFSNGEDDSISSECIDEEMFDTIVECLYEAKKDINTLEIADYYSALLYKLGIVYNDNSIGTNMSIGGEMLINLARYKNKYARRFLLFGLKNVK